MMPEKKPVHNKRITKPDMSKYVECPNCRTWQKGLNPCPKCGVITLIDFTREKGGVAPRDMTLSFKHSSDDTYITRALHLLEDGKWHPKTEIMIETGIKSKNSIQATRIWSRLEKLIEIQHIRPRPKQGAYIWIRKKVE